VNVGKAEKKRAWEKKPTGRVPNSTGGRQTKGARGHRGGCGISGEHTSGLMGSSNRVELCYVVWRTKGWDQGGRGWSRPKREERGEEKCSEKRTNRTGSKGGGGETGRVTPNTGGED